MDTVDILRVTFVGFTYTTRGSWGWGYPGEAKSTSCEISVKKIFKKWL